MVPSTPHSGLILHTSNRLERLADQLAKLIANPLRSPLLPEIILVQSNGMRRWLELSIEIFSMTWLPSAEMVGVILSIVPTSSR